MRFFIPALLCLATLSCTFDRYHSNQTAEVRLSVPKKYLEDKPKILGAPSSYAVDCFLLDVNGPGIDPMYADSNPFTTVDLGQNSSWVSRASLVATGSTTLSIRVPIGRSRTVRILGVTGTPAITNCATQTFAGYPASGMLAAPPYPQVFELARATIDVFSPSAVDTTVVTNPATDTMPPAVTHTAGAADSLYLGNSLPDFSEGPPPNTGAFGAFQNVQSTGVLNGRARMDFVLDVSSLNLKSYRGLQVKLEAAGGAVNCGATGTPAISTASDLVLGLWNETGYAWSQKNSYVSATDQTLTYTHNFTGINLFGAQTPVDDGGGQFNSLYVSLRVQDAPGTGCSAINLNGATFTLFQ